MKYMLMCLAALLFCFGTGALLANLIGKNMKKRHLRMKKTGLAMVFGILLCLGVTFGYLSIYYHADPDAIEAAYENPAVQIETIKGGYFFDGPGADTAMIFYPGAKVESMAYASLLTQLAENGIDCFLADVPFHMAMFGSNLADDFIRDYHYEKWITAGHSMGGIVASGYAVNHPEQIQGIVMLASYPTKKIGDEFQYCSVYGNQDGCLNKTEYEKMKENWPGNGVELCISGGNHAQFGDYGVQKGDGTADISAEEQQRITVDKICDSMR